MKLTISKETLTELSPSDLTSVAAGLPYTGDPFTDLTGYYLTLPVDQCLSRVTQ